MYNIPQKEEALRVFRTASFYIPHFQTGDTPVKTKRSAMNRMRPQPSLWLALVALLALAGLLRPPAAHAAAITVVAGEVAVSANGQCSLREAIINANNDAATHADCAAGSGTDTITLPAAATFAITDSYASYNGNTGLPQVTTTILINGNGSTIDRNSGTSFRLFALSSTGNLTLNNLTLTDGAMPSDMGGGAVLNVGGTLTINDSTLSGHTGTNSQGGGAIHASGGTTTINRSTLHTNQASNSGGGGAIYANNGATVNVTDSTIRNNTAANTSGGGIRLNFTGTNVLNVTGSTVSNNSANGGGGIAHGSGSATITNSTLSGNTSQSNGGGVDFASATGTLNNVTVTGNTAGAGGGGGGGGVYSNATLNLNRSLISGNFGPTGYDSGYELVGNGTENANNYNVFGRSDITNNRAFAYSFTPGATDVTATSNGTQPTALAGILNTTLANNGGPTDTHALVAGSPAVDRAPSAACAAAPINGVDQRSYPRNVDGNAAASANECDTGAFEYLSSPPPTTGDIVIVKEATPADNTPFDFTEDIPGPGNGFTLTDPADNTETFDDVAPGSYTVGETGETGWSLDDLTCVDPSNNTTTDLNGGTAVINLSAGETVTCTFSNSRDTGTVVIQKEADPEDDTAFDFTENIHGGGGLFTLTDPSDNIEQFDDVPTGSYLVNETGEAGWTLDSITCDDANSTGNTATGQATINVEKDEVVTCVFENSRDTGTITIVKDATPADDTPFDFSETIPGAGTTFTLMDPSDASETFSNVPTGSYTVTETVEAGWTLDSIVCVDPDDGSSTAGAAATIDLDDGETVTCTFNNSRDTGTIIIEKAAAPADDTPFTFTEDIESTGFTLMDPSDNSVTFSGVPTGSYAVIEDATAGWSLDGITCDDANSTTDTGTRTATINLEDGETVTCTFSNSEIPAPVADIYVSANDAGVTTDNVAFGPHDILAWDGSAWSKWFDGSAAGLMPVGPNKHDINALWIPDPAGDDVVLGFVQNARVVPGISGKVNGMDLVWWDGATFSLWFDGEDVGLTNLTQEKIDALHVLDGSLAPPALAASAGSSCDAYLLLSTAGDGQVPNYSGGTIKFDGTDVLGFCLTQSGATTQGKWTRVLNGKAEGMPGQALVNLSASDDGQVLFFTTRATFNVDTAQGGHSMVYRYDFATGQFSGPYFSAPANGLSKTVDGLHVNGELP